MHSTPDTTPATTRPQTTPEPPAAIVRTPTDRAPQTFSRNSDRLQNLIDEFNAGFAHSGE